MLEVVARWVTDEHFVDRKKAPRALAMLASQSQSESSFTDLAKLVSKDARPKALLDELLRLGLVNVIDNVVTLNKDGFAPRQEFSEMCALFRENLHDHMAAAVANLNGEQNFLEQAIFVDQLSEASADEFKRVAKAAWKDALAKVLKCAQERFDWDAANTKKSKRIYRARFGAYHYSKNHD